MPRDRAGSGMLRSSCGRVPACPELPAVGSWEEVAVHWPQNSKEDIFLQVGRSHDNGTAWAYVSYKYTGDKRQATQLKMRRRHRQATRRGS